MSWPQTCLHGPRHKQHLLRTPRCLLPTAAASRGAQEPGTARAPLPSAPIPWAQRSPELGAQEDGTAGHQGLCREAAAGRKQRAEAGSGCSLQAPAWLSPQAGRSVCFRGLRMENSEGGLSPMHHTQPPHPPDQPQLQVCGHSRFLILGAVPRSCTSPSLFPTQTCPTSAGLQAQLLPSKHPNGNSHPAIHPRVHPGSSVHPKQAARTL